MSTENASKTLCNLQAGRTGKVVELQGGHGFASRMAALGFTPGVDIAMVQNFGRGPIIVMVRGTRIALGRGEADQVWIKTNGDHDGDTV
jgi:ferrous iron transport protein A